MKRISQLIFLLFLSDSLLAQPSNPAPVGGVAYLLIAGVLFGVFSIYKTKKKQ